jgi:hypothetical protein
MTLKDDAAMRRMTAVPASTRRREKNSPAR